MFIERMDGLIALVSSFRDLDGQADVRSLSQYVHFVCFLRPLILFEHSELARIKSRTQAAIATQYTGSLARQEILQDELEELERRLSDSVFSFLVSITTTHCIV
jgi:hypothetical protein